MISFINSSYNALSNLNVNVRVKENAAQNTANINTNQSKDMIAKKDLHSLSSGDLASNSSTQAFGYALDENGFFTKEFNEAVGIPQDYKIHYSSLESLVRVEADDTRHESVKEFNSVDIVKTLGNAYKVLSQVVGEDILNSKDSFSRDEIANFPQGYEYNRQTMEVMKIHQSSLDYISADLGFNFQNNNDIKIDELFFNTTENRMQGKSAIDIFNNYNGGEELVGVFINVNGAKYTNADGSITKGGLLMAVINSNVYVREGEATEFGKVQGFDKSMSFTELKALQAEWSVLKFDPENPKYVYGAGEINPNAQKEWEEMLKNYKDPLTKLFENISEQQKLSLKELIDKQKDLKEIIQKAVLEKTKKVDIEA